MFGVTLAISLLDGRPVRGDVFNTLLCRRGTVRRGSLLFGSRGRLAPRCIGLRCRSEPSGSARQRWRRSRALRRRRPRFISPVGSILALANAGLSVGSAALSLRVIEQRALAIELLQRHAPLGTDLRPTRRNCKAPGTIRLAGSRVRVDFGALALDASALRSIVVGSLHGERSSQQRRQHKTR